MKNIIKVSIDNKEKEYTIITTFEIKKNKYIAFLDDEESEILIYKYIELDDENISLSDINDLEWESVIETFNKLLKCE